MTTYPEITMSSETIHNPNEPRHFMRAKPISRLTRIHRGDQVIAETTDGLRVTELARDMLDPVVYIPRKDLSIEIALVKGKTSHCPLKGDATYYHVGDDAPIAWSYESPFGFCDVLKDRIAFYPDEVTVEEIGANAS